MFLALFRSIFGQKPKDTTSPSAIQYVVDDVRKQLVAPVILGHHAAWGKGTLVVPLSNELRPIYRDISQYDAQRICAELKLPLVWAL